MELHAEHYGIRSLLLEGGGHINGVFLDAGRSTRLASCSSLYLMGATRSRQFSMALPPCGTAPFVKLKSVGQRGNDALWIRYEVIRSQGQSSRSTKCSVTDIWIADG
jgi:riboflavin biosynthesis pyrimidine reductase